MYSIFHTSHCGSTYLSALLSKSLPTLAEPDWSHEVYNQENPLEYIKQHQKDNEIIKYSSVCCYLMPLIKGKKVFLYRKLHDQIQKKKDDGSVAFHLSVMEKRFHPKTKLIEHDYSPKLLQAILWADRVFWAIDSKDTMFVEANDLFKNPQFTAKQICKFFDIKYIPVDINFDVKHKNNKILRSNKYINIDESGHTEEYIMPYIPIDFKTLKIQEQIIDQFSKLKYFV
jgi:hypothetical protein